MKKYKKLFRYLFSKYANSCYSKRINVFDDLREKSELITIAEITKMLNDNNVNSHMLARESLATIMRLINVKTQRNDLTTMTYEGFQECIMQVAIYIYSKPPVVLSHLPLVESVKAFVKHFQEATAYKGESVILYTDPNTTAMGDKDLLKELNKIVRVDSNYPVPEGYRKITEKEINFAYELKGKASSFVKESMKISVEILDELIEFSFSGSHILESAVEYETNLKVYPDIVKPIKQQIPVRYMEKIEKRIKSIEPNLKKQSESFSLPKIKKFEEPRRKLPVGTKMVIANLPKELRIFGTDVGEVIEEILDAVEEGKTELVKKKGNRIINQAVKSKQELEEELRQAEIEKEGKRKSRHQLLKQKLDELAKKKQVEDASKRKEEEVKKAKEKEAHLKEMEEKKIERDELKKKIKGAKEKKEADRKIAEEDAKKKQKEEEEKRQKEREEFYKKRKDEMVIFSNHKNKKLGKSI